MARITGALRGGLCVFMMMSSLTYSENEKCFRQKLQGKSKHISYSITFSENRAVYEIMWKNVAEQAGQR